MAIKFSIQHFRDLTKNLANPGANALAYIHGFVLNDLGEGNYILFRESPYNEGITIDSDEGIVYFDDKNGTLTAFQKFALNLQRQEGDLSKLTE